MARLKAGCGDGDAASALLQESSSLAGDTKHDGMQEIELLLLRAETLSTLGEHETSRDMCNRAKLLLTHCTGYKAKLLSEQAEWRGALAAAHLQDRSEAQELMSRSARVFPSSIARAQLGLCLAAHLSNTNSIQHHPTKQLDLSKKVTVAELRGELKKHGLSTAGNKAPLAQRLKEFYANQTSTLSENGFRANLIKQAYEDTSCAGDNR
eukprot:TRINITY_DN40024_c0_g1_i1.p1 TRINITY_DN40024_c0_g1~~TRINITY_DN40024_c0_g1_i1.p1  ORF type:complete len:209 (+),score=25.85 TRINITY_DN40024_c0_g1_i1:105-731(+)